MNKSKPPVSNPDNQNQKIKTHFSAAPLQRVTLQNNRWIFHGQMAFI